MMDSEAAGDERGQGEPSTAYKQQTRAELALLGTCAIWGTSFVMVRRPRYSISPHSELTLRFDLTFLLHVLFAYANRRVPLT